MSDSLISSNQDLSENQCIFVRGFRATRIAKILPTLRAAAGPVQIPASELQLNFRSGSGLLNWPVPTPTHSEDDLDAEMQLMSFPGDTRVNVTISHFQPLSDVSKYQEPFYTLLKYIAIVRVSKSITYS